LKGRIKAGAVIALLLLILSASARASAASEGVTANQEYPNSSWALGVVVPEGATLQNGSVLYWGRATNVTVLVNLPNIGLPDGVVYVVESIMTEGQGVLQVAAGIYPNNTSWFSYSWSIRDIDATPLTYNWILNHSVPAMASGDLVTISIYQEAGLWNLRVADARTGASVERLFPGGMAKSIVDGDQEVLALESYSRTPSTFMDMGNLTLQTLLVNGEAVVGGLYSYSAWDTLRNPVFVVGSPGTSAPSFISLEPGTRGTITWNYQTWGGPPEPLVGLEISIIVLVLVSFSILGTILWVTRTRPDGDAPMGRWSPELLSAS
jgi:hypothetical protein